ncbi:K(+)-transporting ATPase subunit C [Amnibacterium endophyticum]|uniref:Potassium-transporting ATPase KdpC subunit n=1 Tax=Amnibacterium endophyticum TaxID=2109337 RepID=A0ABW4LHY4_9MICO
MPGLLARGAVRTWTTALRLLVATVVATVLLTAVVLGIGRVALPAQADGSLVAADGRVVGSALIAQPFADADGRALPQWFQPRPSAVDHDGGASGGSNLGPDSAVLVRTIAERRAAYLALNGPGPVPVDALTASGSGLDPHVSEQNALRQADRVARARDLPAARVRALVEAAVQAPDLGFLGQPTVNVLLLNRALSAL